MKCETARYVSEYDTCRKVKACMTVTTAEHSGMDAG
jgi:hypothetical protein